MEDKNWLRIAEEVNGKRINQSKNVERFYRTELEPILIHLKKAFINNKAEIVAKKKDGEYTPHIRTDNYLLRDEVQEILKSWLASSVGKQPPRE
jgi:hypothetical protein